MDGSTYDIGAAVGKVYNSRYSRWNTPVGRLYPGITRVPQSTVSAHQYETYLWNIHALLEYTTSMAALGVATLGHCFMACGQAIGDLRSFSNRLVFHVSPFLLLPSTDLDPPSSISRACWRDLPHVAWATRLSTVRRTGTRWRAFVLLQETQNSLFLRTAKIAPFLTPWGRMWPLYHLPGRVVKRLKLEMGEYSYEQFTASPGGLMCCRALLYILPWYYWYQTCLVAYTRT